MYERTQERIDEIIARNLENTAEASPAIVSYGVKSIGDHGHIVIFNYDNWTHKTYDGRKWS